MRLLASVKHADSRFMNDSVYVCLISGLVSIAIAWIRRHDVREARVSRDVETLDPAAPSEIWERYG